MVGTANLPPAGASTEPGTAGLFRPGSPVLRWPALLVLGIAVLIVVVGLVGAAESGGSSQSPARPAVRQVTLADGTAVTLVPGQVALRRLAPGGLLPTDILDSLSVPAGSQATGAVDGDRAAGQFDRTVDFATTAPADEIASAYQLALPRSGWRVVYRGPGVRAGRSGTEVLATRGGSDGNDWEVGVVVSPATAAGVTPFAVEVFEVAGDT